MPNETLQILVMAFIYQVSAGKHTPVVKVLVGKGYNIASSGHSISHTEILLLKKWQIAVFT